MKYQEIIVAEVPRGLQPSKCLLSGIWILSPLINYKKRCQRWNPSDKIFWIRALFNKKVQLNPITVVPTKRDSDLIFCLQLLNKTLTCTLHLS